jgi:uncharacterized protein YbjT (DUF2867 family)
LVTGGTGFVGRVVVHALRAEGHVVRCLVRRGSERDLRGFEAIERVEGDVLDRRSLEHAVGGCDTVVHLVGIIEEHPARGVTFEHLHHQATVNVLDAAQAAGVRRFLHMSALGTRPHARSRYHQTKWAAEESVRASGLPWVIFRPSVIYGRGDGFVSMLARMVSRLPIVPVLGDGRQELQPVAVEQVAEGFARAVTLPAAVKQAFEVGGPTPIAFAALLDLVGQALGKRRVLKAHVPLGLVRPLARALSPLPWFPITPDQLLMLEERNTCDATPFFSAFGLIPTPLESGLRRMLA